MRAHDASRLLTVRYLAGLALIAATLFAGQLVIQHLIATQRDDAAVINLAGRQRMVSQQLAKTALAMSSPAVVDHTSYAKEMESLAHTWQRVHRGLIAGDADLGLPPAPDETIAKQLYALDTAVVTLIQATSAIAQHPTDQSAVASLLSSEQQFRIGMDSVVASFERHAADKVQRLRQIELALAIMMACLLIAEALWVFRPAVQRVRVALAASLASEDDLQQACDRLEHRLADEEPRVRLEVGQELHDGLGQRLTALALMTKALEKKVPSDIAPLITDLVQGINATITESRGLARSLHGDRLDGGDLRHALEQVVVQAKRAGSDCVLQWEPQCRPPTGDAAWQLLRIAQEAVTNAQRHAGTGTITMTCARDDQALLLTISDQGPGILADKAEGLGLRIMRARARRISADLLIDGTPDHGTRIRCRWTPPPSASSPEIP